MDDSQRRSLEQLYQQTSKPTVVQRESMARALNLPPRTVQAWFQERKTKAKADKLVEEMQTKRVLASANEHPVVNHNSDHIYSRQQAHRTQSAASYASLRRSLAAAAACIPTHQNDVFVDAVPDSPGFASEFPMISPCTPTFDHTNMYRSDSQYSGMSTPLEASEQPDYSWTPSNYSPYGGYNSPYGQLPTRSIETAKPLKTSSSRPGLTRTRTCPDAFSRPIPRRTVSSSSFSESYETPEPGRFKRRPRLSPLGVGMTRSQSSLGYESSEHMYHSSRRTCSNIETGQPVTPIRPGSSLVMNGTTNSQTDSFHHGIQYVSGHDLRFPPSPISPEQVQMFQQSNSSFSCFDLQSRPVEEGFTPPDTPLTAMTSSQENILSNSAHEEGFFNDLSNMGPLDLSQINLTTYELTLSDLFPEKMANAVMLQ